MRLFNQYKTTKQMIFTPTQKEAAIKYLEKLLEKSKFVKIEHVTESRTLNQNAYMWLVFTNIADQTGSDKNYMYHLFMKRFPVLQELKNEFGELELCPVSMSMWTKEQSSDFIDKMVTELRASGFEVPDCEDYEALKMYNWYKQRGIL